jgi:gluconate kinase
MRRRGTEHIKESMVESQLAVKEQPSAYETDRLPVDAGKSIEEVVEEVVALLAVTNEML